MIDMKQVSAALVQAQRNFGPALKDRTNPAFRSKYADLGSCIDAVMDALNAAGIALVQRQHPAESGVAVETIFVHESGEQLSAGILQVPAVKHDPQGYGSALTYARRYSLMSACGIAPEDDDGNAAAKAKAAEPAPAPLTPSQVQDWIQAIETAGKEEFRATKDEALAAAQAARDREAYIAIRSAAHKRAEALDKENT
jgi:hypothetical protein